jgi:acetoin utilization protein AcuB
MIVEEIMRKKVITLTLTDTIRRAKLLMLTNDIRHLPVIDENNHVIGLITRSDIYQNSLSNGDDEDRASVSEIMNKNVITGHPFDFIEEVSAIFYNHKIGCLPIIENQGLVGIITETDMLHTFVQLTGANQPGSQIEIQVPNRAGMLSAVAEVVKEHKVNILSILVYPAKDESHKILTLRIQTMNPLPVIKALQASEYEVLWPRISGVNNE